MDILLKNEKVNWIYVRTLLNFQTTSKCVSPPPPQDNKCVLELYNKFVFIFCCYFHLRFGVSVLDLWSFDKLMSWKVVVLQYKTFFFIWETETNICNSPIQVFFFLVTSQKKKGRRRRFSCLEREYSRPFSPAYLLEFAYLTITYVS